MTDISAAQSGLQGIYTGMQSLRENAQVIVSQGATNAPTGKESTDALVDTISNQHQVEASAKTVKAYDEMLGTLIDEMA